MRFWRGGYNCCKGMFGNQVTHTLDLRVWVFLSLYSLAVTFAASEHTKLPARLPGKPIHSQ